MQFFADFPKWTSSLIAKRIVTVFEPFLNSRLVLSEESEPLDFFLKARESLSRP